MSSYRSMGLRAVVAGSALAVLLSMNAGVDAAAAEGDGAAASAPEEVVTIVRSDAARPLEAAEAYAQLMAIPSTDTGYIPNTQPPLAGGEAACPPGRCRDYQLTVPPGVKVSSSMVRVLLPTGYDLRRNREKRYPVVYLYNGALSAYDAWSRKTMITSMSRDMDAIFVMPEGGYNDEAGMFSDWRDGSFDWETFHTEVVIPWVDQTFRTLPGARAAAGPSMGSLGSLGYAARHPGLFQAVMTLSGLVDTNQLSANTLPPELASALGLAPPDLTRVWGSPVLDRSNWDRHNPTALARSLRDVKVLISSGTGFQTTGSGIHSGSVEQLVWQGHRTFLAALTAAKVSYVARISQGGVHDWPWFHTSIEWGFPQLIGSAVRASAALAGAQYAPPDGKGSRFVRFPASRSCASHELTPTITKKGRRAERIRSVSFFVNDDKARTIRRPSKGKAVTLRVPDGKDVDVRAVVKLVKRGSHAKKRETTVSYYACS